MKKILFFGSGAFAAAVLEHLARRCRIALVVTAPPAPAGRKAQLTLPPAALFARQRRLLLAHSLDKTQLAALGVDYAVVCDYGKMIPADWLSILPVLNVHPSLLPKWRGAAPIQRAVLAGDACSGISIMRVSERLDSGDVHAQWSMPLPAQMSAQELSAVFAKQGAELLLQVMAAYADYPPRKQDEKVASYAHKINAAERRLDFSQSARQCVRQVLAFTPAPGAYCFINGKRVRVLAALAATGDGHSAGTLVAAKDSIVIACAAGNLEITRLQQAGKKAMDSAEYLRGQPLTDYIGQPPA